MNAQTFSALFRDALYQVLDNKVFRVLAVIVVGMVAATFLIGAREDGLVLLFGVETIEYKQIFGFFNRPYPGLEGAGEILVQSMQTLIVDGLAGTFGIIFAIAATAFFVPRMLEKGAADTLFSKPVNRGMLLFSRYLAGLLFVAVLAVSLVGGMHIGFLVSSGYSDPGFLWSILTLVYVFALLHGVSILVGVLTRSTVAAILLTLLFMTFNGCVHGGWQAKDMFLDHSARGGRLSMIEEEQPASPDAKPEEDSVWIVAAYATLDAAHWVLPKTGDAALISRKLRRDLALSYAELWDEEGGLLVQGPPVGWERRAGIEALRGEGALWVLPDGTASIRLKLEPGPDLSRLRASKTRRKALEERAQVRDIEDERSSIGGTPSSRIDWVETGPEGERSRRVHYFPGKGCLYALEIEGTPQWRADEPADAVVQQFVRGMTFDESSMASNPSARFENLLGWNAPLPYNIFFSIGSSLAFLGLMLAIAWLRLSRIDF